MGSYERGGRICNRRGVPVKKIQWNIYDGEEYIYTLVLKLAKQNNTMKSKHVLSFNHKFKI